MESLASEPIFSFDRYPIEIKQQNGLFYLFCQTLGVIESDTTLDGAYKKLNQKRLDVSKHLNLFGIELNENDKQYRVSKTKAGRLGKYVLVVFLFLVPVTMVAGYGFVSNKILGLINGLQISFKHKIMSTFGDPSQVTVMLEHVADTLEKITPERKEELQLTMRRIVKSIQPIAEEIKPLYTTDK